MTFLVFIYLAQAFSSVLNGLDVNNVDKHTNIIYLYDTKI